MVKVAPGLCHSQVHQPSNHIALSYKFLELPFKMSIPEIVSWYI